MSLATLNPHVLLANVLANLLFWAPYIASLALIISLVCLVLLLSLRARMKRLTVGTSGSIEETLAILARENKEMVSFRADLEKYLKLAESRLRKSIQGVGIVRFNPFKGEGSGGNQSFAAAFLDEGGRGVVFSSLYTRGHVGVYAKPLEDGKSPFELTEEERTAITRAKESIGAHKKK